MNEIDSRMNSIFGWDAVTGDGRVSLYNAAADVEVALGDDPDLADARFYVSPIFPEIAVIYLGANQTAPDILAHEYIHLVTKTTYDPDKGGEQGAVAEHFPDLIAMTLFPDTTWDLASRSPGGAFGTC